MWSATAGIGRVVTVRCGEGWPAEAPKVALDVAAVLPSAAAAMTATVIRLVLDFKARIVAGSFV